MGELQRISFNKKSNPLNFLSTDPAEKRYQCAFCKHWIEALEIQSHPGHYVRRNCLCQQSQKFRPTTLPDEKRIHPLDAFTWLGEFGLPQLAHHTFDNFIRFREKEAYLKIVQYAANPQGVVVIEGPYGSGKTHLLSALCNHLSEQQTPVLFARAAKFVGAIHQRIQLNENKRIPIIRMSQVRFAAFDDIDKLIATDATEGYCLEVLDARYEAGLPTAISCNNADDLPRILGGAGYSRLGPFTRITTVSGDFRKEEKK